VARQRRRRERPQQLTDVRPGFSARQAQRKRRYFAIMGPALVLVVLAWNVVRLYSVTAAVVMSAVAAVLPPVAAIVANRHEDR
jgi:Flp pilus assembly protein TadB